LWEQIVNDTTKGDTDIVQLTESVSREFAGRIDREVIARTVQEAADSYESARIRQFLPILIRRRVVLDLRERSRQLDG
jgi:hypothetical protein